MWPPFLRIKNRQNYEFSGVSKGIGEIKPLYTPVNSEFGYILPCKKKYKFTNKNWVDIFKITVKKPSNDKHFIDVILGFLLHQLVERQHVNNFHHGTSIRWYCKTPCAQMYPPS